jgi:hypothetical protein
VEPVFCKSAATNKELEKNDDSEKRHFALGGDTRYYGAEESG